MFSCGITDFFLFPPVNLHISLLGCLNQPKHHYPVPISQIYHPIGPNTVVNRAVIILLVEGPLFSLYKMQQVECHKMRSAGVYFVVVFRCCSQLACLGNSDCTNPFIYILEPTKKKYFFLLLMFIFRLYIKKPEN